MTHGWGYGLFFYFSILKIKWDKVQSVRYCRVFEGSLFIHTSIYIYIYQKHARARAQSPSHRLRTWALSIVPERIKLNPMQHDPEHAPTWGCCCAFASQNEPKVIQKSTKLCSKLCPGGLSALQNQIPRTSWGPLLDSRRILLDFEDSLAYMWEGMCSKNVLAQ